jgi:hypothetical protein
MNYIRTAGGRAQINVVPVAFAPRLDAHSSSTEDIPPRRLFLFPASPFMSSRGFFARASEWLRALLQNMYFWGGMLVLFGIGLGVYLLVDAVLMPSYTRHHVSTTVPNVEDVAFSDARQRLQQENLKVQRQIGRYNPNVDTGIVVDQTPLPTAKVKPGRRVYLTVNAGEVPIVQIPDLRGMSVREAKNRISSVDLEVGTVQKDEIPSPYANTITKQEPAPGDSLEEGSSIDLWYSTGLGDAEVAVPNVVGLSVAEAKRFLLQHELRTVLVDTATTADDAPAPSMAPATRDSLEQHLYVRRQASAPGDSVRAGTEVRLYTTPDAEKAAELRKNAEADASSATDPVE